MGYVPPKGDDAVEDHYKRTMTKLGAHKSKALSRSLFCGLWSIVVDDRSLRPHPPRLPPRLFCGLWLIIAEELLFPCAVDEVAEKPTGLMERVRRKSLEMVLGQDAAPDAAQMAALLAGGGEVRSRDSRGDAQLKPLLLLLLTLSAFFGSLLEPRRGHQCPQSVSTCPPSPSHLRARAVPVVLIGRACSCAGRGR